MRPGSGSSSSSEALTLAEPARSQQLVDLLVDVEPAAAVTWLPLFTGDESFTVPFRVRGFVDVARAGLGRVPFDESGVVSMTADGLVVVPAVEPAS